MSKKCYRCAKPVYAAELRMAEGHDWHHGCFALWFKEKQANKKADLDEKSYNKSADVAPSYYRVADVDSGAPPRLESSVGEVRPVGAGVSEVVLEKSLSPQNATTAPPAAASPYN